MVGHTQDCVFSFKISSQLVDDFCQERGNLLDLGKNTGVFPYHFACQKIETSCKAVAVNSSPNILASGSLELGSMVTLKF